MYIKYFGYVLIWFLFYFLDIDECSVFKNVCDVNVVCINMEGFYFCFCKFGFIGNGKYCSGKNLINKELVCWYIVKYVFI